MSFHQRRSVGVVVVGGGPGGLATLFAAASHQKLAHLLEAGVIVLEKTAVLGPGTLKNHTIRSDSAAEAFLEIAARTDHPGLASLRNHPSYAAVEAHIRNAVPLPLVSTFLHCAGDAMVRIIETSPRGRVYRRAKALSTQQLSKYEWNTTFLDTLTGHVEQVSSRSVVLATGAHQPRERLFSEKVAGEPLLPKYSAKVVSSGHFLGRRGPGEIRKLLSSKRDPKVVIVGGSASAGSVARILLDHFPGTILFGNKGVTLLHRSPIRIYYGSAAEAEADGYTDWNDSDLCSLTGRIHRLGGLRFDSRECIMRAQGIGGRVRDSRLHLQPLEETNLGEVRDILEEADLIVAAIGYVPRGLPILDSQHVRVPLMIDLAGSHAMVDAHSRVLDATGRPLEGLFGIGLATGRPSTANLGGESNFKGQVNSIWLWQNTIGLEIIDQVLGRATDDEAGLTQDAPVDKSERSLHQTAKVGLVSSRHQPEASLSPKKDVLLSIPMISPNPPRLSEHIADLQSIETSGFYSNYGPVNTRLEQSLVSSLFKEGGCLSVCNATTGLMLAIRDAIGEGKNTERRFALMPSFTFAATAHAALWNGLTPLFCDIDPDTWLPSAQSEESLLAKYEGQIAVVVPYATFGNNLDLERYQQLSTRHSVPIVVDAAASLGSKDEAGRQFGSGFLWPIVYSMHATKVFATGEGGIIYCGDEERLRRLRSMGSFGFEGPAGAARIGLNSKLSEVAALIALLQLERFDSVLDRQERLALSYRAELPDLQMQKLCGMRQSKAFESILLPTAFRKERNRITAALSGKGIGCGTYFSPHLAQHPYFQQYGRSGSLPVTNDIAGRILNLPMYDTMSPAEVLTVSLALAECCHDQKLLHNNTMSETTMLT